MIEQLLYNLIKILAALVVTLPVAWERERDSRIMGLRTFPLVAVASCSYILIATTIIGDDRNAQARILQGLITGIGFIGGGAILKQEGMVRGTATAASIWTTGAVGAAVAYGRYEIAIAISLINFAVLRFLTPLKDQFGPEGE